VASTATKIQFVCVASHSGDGNGHDGPAVTLHERSWAYCRLGGFTDHEWTHVAGDGATIEELHARLITHKPRAGIA
jgi:hypothetical protein